MGVGHELRALVGGVALERERAGPDERLAPFAEVGALGDDDRVVVVGGDDVGEVPVGRLQMEGHRVGVDLLDAAGRQHALERRQRVGGVLGVGQLLEGVDHVVGGHRLAVGELDALAQGERPHRAVAVVRPLGGQHRLQLELQVVVEGQELAGLGQHRAAAGIVDQHRVHRRRRRLGGELERAALGGAARARRRCRRRSAAAASRVRRVVAAVGAAAGGQHRAHHRRGHPQDRTATQERAAIQPPRHQFVDVVVLELGALLAHGVELSIINPHVRHLSVAGDRPIAADGRMLLGWRDPRPYTAPSDRTGRTDHRPMRDPSETCGRSV
jgi:hypothetical protein